MDRIDEIWRQVVASVCTVCADDGPNGLCRLQQGGPCSLKEQFPTVVEAIASVKGASYAPYVKALREKVCLACHHRQDAGRCVIRDKVECPIDRYYPLVIDAVGSALSLAA